MSKLTNKEMKNMLDTIDHNWSMSSYYINKLITNLENSSEEEVEYEILEELFNKIDLNSLTTDKCDYLKKKFSNAYRQYEEQQAKENERLNELINQQEKKYPGKDMQSIISDALGEFSDVRELHYSSDEYTWTEEKAAELDIKKEWIDKDASISRNAEFDDETPESRLRKNIKRAITKYVDLLAEFEMFSVQDSTEYVDSDEEIPMVEHKTEIKYEMLQYFDTLCNFRDKVSKPRMMPSA